MYSSQKGENTTVTKGVATDPNNLRFSVTLPFTETQFFLQITTSDLTYTRKIDLSEIWVPPDAVLITEIFPRSSASEPEWFEITNLSPMRINLRGWFFGSVEDTLLLIGEELYLGASEFAVATRRKDILSARYPLSKNIFQPPGWYTLNNYNDTLLLWSSQGQLVDAVCYHSSWFKNWGVQSVERTDMSISGLEPSCWRLSEQPTPGAPNRSVHLRSESASLDIGPIPFSPDGDGRDDYLAIRVGIPTDRTARIIIYSFDGREVLSMPGKEEPVMWDGRCNAGKHIANGPFFVLVEFTNSNGQRSFLRKKGVLWRK